MKSYPAKVRSFQQKLVQMGALQKLQNSLQTLLILWPNFYPVHTNSLVQVIFEELPFLPFSSSIKYFFSWLRPQIQLIFHLKIQFFKQTENKHTLSQSSHVSAKAYGKQEEESTKYKFPQLNSIKEEMTPHPSGSQPPLPSWDLPWIHLRPYLKKHEALSQIIQQYSVILIFLLSYFGL